MGKQDERTDERMDGRTNGRTDERTDERTDSLLELAGFYPPAKNQKFSLSSLRVRPYDSKCVPGYLGIRKAYRDEENLTIFESTSQSQRFKD